jgi:hypothetical protein
VTPALRPEALRLFPHYQVEDLEAPAARPFLLARLLEDGDGADLLALFHELPEAEAAAWLATHGGRQLSARSRAFWQIVLGTEAGPASAGSPALWPL